MIGFNRKGGSLYVDEVPLTKLAKTYGTPAYVYSASQIKQNFQNYLNSIRPKDKICYSVKSNSNSHILKMLSKKGCGFDVVSGNELKKCLSSGARPKDIIFSGVGKTKEEIMLALKEEIFSINIESEQELERIIKLIKKMKPSNKDKDLKSSKKKGYSAENPVNCFIRVNPDISAKSHPYIQTGLKSSKFGVSKTTLVSMAKKAKESKVVNLIGIASHIGSQITNKNLILENLLFLIQVAEIIKSFNHDLAYLDLGGGLGIKYKEEELPTAQEILSEVLEIMSPLNLNLIVEPGRSISGNAGVLLSKIEYIKKTKELNIAVIDSGMNDMVRPSLYQAWHNISTVDSNQEGRLPYKIVGPVCESADTFGENRELSLKENSLVAIHDVGAYGYVMSSNYNSRLRPPEILVEGKKIKLIRRRETLEDLIAQEYDI